MAAYNGTGKGLGYVGTDGDDVFTSRGNNYFYGGLGIDTFKCLFGTTYIHDLGQGGGDVLNVDVGANAVVTVATNWVATTKTYNSGGPSAVTIETSGYLVDVTAATGSYGYVVTNIGAGTTIYGSRFSDQLTGGKGNDTIKGGGGGDTINSGGGNDTILSDGGEIVYINSGKAFIDTLSGQLAKLYISPGATVNIDTSATPSTQIQNDGVLNVSLKKPLRAGTSSSSSSVDFTNATGSGSFSISADNTSKSEVIGSPNSDIIKGNGILSGGAGNDTIYGSVADDYINGGVGNDVLYGNGGSDNFIVAAGIDKIMDFGGNSTVNISAGATLNAYVTSPLQKKVNAVSNGNNAGNANFYTSGINVQLETINFSNNGLLSITNTGAGASLSARDSSGKVSITGGSGNDSISGGLASDVLIGGAGNDVIDGGPGDDFLDGGDGDDNYRDNSGSDTYVVKSGTDIIYNIGFTLKTGQGISDASDVIQVDPGATLYLSGLQADFSGKNALWKPTANSFNNGSVYISTQVSVDLSAIVTGKNGFSISNSGDGATLVGSGLSDSIGGGNGDDLLDGGAAADTLTGNLGADTFVLSNGDVVTDFSAAEGDKINIRFLKNGDSVTILSKSTPPVFSSPTSGIFFSQSSVPGNGVRLTIDSLPPTLSVSADKTSLGAGDTALVKFTLSESVPGFRLSQLTVSGGKLSNFSGSGTVYTATFTPDSNSNSDGSVGVAPRALIDAAGNANAFGSFVTLKINTVGGDLTPPTVAISADKTNLIAGETANIVFTLSEPSLDFQFRDISWNGGTLSNFTGSGTRYTAIFTPLPNSMVSGVISVDSFTFSDAAGNFNFDGFESDNRLTLMVNTTNNRLPTIALNADKTSLRSGETATINFTLSTPSKDFVASDVTVTGGKLSAFQGSGTRYTAIFTPATNATSTGVISVGSGAFTDAAGKANADGSEPDNTLTLMMNTDAADTTPPTVTIGVDKTSLGTGQTAIVSFTLSEPSKNFFASCVTVTGGKLSDFGGSGTSYQAVFVPTEWSSANGVIGVASGAFTDAAGNGNTPASKTITVSTRSILVGTIGGDVLTGTTGADSISGLAGNDQLIGLEGNDTLNGGLGNDTMRGGAGDDTYIVDNDVIEENANEGIDTVHTPQSVYTLSINFENLYFIGDVAFKGIGNDSANILTGGAFGDYLEGGLGNDTLTGGAGADKFVFGSALGPTNIDTITDHI